jgi:hypothetical protein
MRILRLIGAILLIVASPAIAKDASGAWIVAQKSGDVQVLRPGFQPASVQIRASLTAGDVVATGPNGRAMLTRGDDYVVVAPGSRLLLPREEPQSGFTRLVQQVGTMLYKVHHTGVPHFAVQTPMLAAVVKGTSFTVIVDHDRAAVQVTDGIVEVSPAVGEARRLVERGMTVYVGRERPDAVIELKPGTVIVPASGGGGGESVKVASSGDIPLSTIASITGGLVREAPAAPVAVTAAQAASGLAVPTVATATGETGGSSLLGPVGEVVQTVPSSTPGADAVDSLAGVTQPAVDVVDTAIPAVAEPVLDTVTAVTQPVLAPVTTVTQPVIDAVTAVTQPVLAPVTTVTQPVIDAVTAVTQPVLAPVTTVTQPVIDTVTAVTQPVLAPVTAVTQPVIDTVSTVAQPVLAPVTAVTQPVIDTVATVTQPVVAPVTTVTQPVINTVTQPVGSALGTIGSLFGNH